MVSRIQRVKIVITWVFTVCLRNVLLTIGEKDKYYPTHIPLEKGLVLRFRVDTSVRLNRGKATAYFVPEYISKYCLEGQS